MSTLDRRQIRNGLAEAVKYGVIRDPKLFAYIEKNVHRLLSGNPQTLKEVVLRCSRIKADVVMEDELETKGVRTILNFGHTIGHAIEAAGQFKIYHHGEAIALGMRVACYISRRLKMLNFKDEERINALLTNVGLPSKIKSLSIQKILQLMAHDKKFVGAKNRFVLTKGIGRISIRENVPMPLIAEAINCYSSR